MVNRTRIKRNIVIIDEDKCNGCGVCVPACAEGAIQIINGKAKLISERYCDGLGACLGTCPQDAITVEEQEVQPFDERAAQRHLEMIKGTAADAFCACPSATVKQFSTTECSGDSPADNAPVQSELTHWPVQLSLVPPTAAFLDNADVVLVGTCVPFAYAGLHRDFIKDHAVIVACPKFDNFEAHLAKLTGIMQHASIKSVTVLHMEVPCCRGLIRMAEAALQQSGKDIPLREFTVSIQGDITPGITDTTA
jgi:NAD-dependent dihydropyrimidine dehydrogenase PreA subunit